MRFVLAAILLLLPGTQASADHLFLAGDRGDHGCETLAAPDNSIIDVYVIAWVTSGAVGAQFSIPEPDCPGVALVDAQVLGGFLSLGDVASGIQIVFQGCLGVYSYIPVMKLQYLVADTDCCELAIRAHPLAASGEVEVIDCSFVERPVSSGQNYTFITNGSGDCGYSPPIRDPSPPDGATNVPVSFSWPDYQIDSAHICPMSLCYDQMYTLYFGTDPEPPLVWTRCMPYPALGPLAPATTYYWRIVVTNCGFHVESPVYRFTTENATPAESRTWGAVKALYRER